MRRLVLILLLVACGKTKGDPSANPSSESADLVVEPLDAGTTMFSAVGIPGGVRVESGGKTFCPPSGVKAKSQRTGDHELRIDIDQRDKPSSAECWMKAVVTVRGLEPGHWKLVVYGLQAAQRAEVDVARL